LGHRVTLVERGEIASEASGVNAGAIGAIGWGRVPDLEAYLTIMQTSKLSSLRRTGSRAPRDQQV
jgi:sarcosine oxidase subunit beta